MITLNGKYTNAKIFIDQVEPECIGQIISFINHIAFTNNVAIMPDTHTGKGSVIGFTMPISNKIIPNVIGVDIGCAVISFNIGKELLDLQILDNAIRNAVPFGFDIHDNYSKFKFNMKDFPWKRANSLAEKFSQAYKVKTGFYFPPPTYSMRWFEDKTKNIGGSLSRFINSIGTLGGGNHFIEVGRSENTGDIWITVHTGSRNLGTKVCSYWQNKASKSFKNERQQKIKEEIEKIKENNKLEKSKIKEQVDQLKISLNEQLQDCDWLEGEGAAGYLYDMIFSQVYAQVNREHIVKIIEKTIKKDRIDQIESVHNYIDFKDFIVRKGAISSYTGERMIIPFNMRDGILICEGKSNSEWNFSAPHGAGRVFSRAKAKEMIKIEDFEKQMEGIYSTSVCRSTLDEAPDAYKDSKIIEAAIEPTAKIIDRVKPIHNMKAK